MKNIVYMDHNATAPIYPAVVDAMTHALSHVGNPSSVHRSGREARKLMEEAREQVARLVNVPSDWVIFTSGGTEADALALNGVDVDRVLVSSVEHAAVMQARDDLEVLEVDKNGVVSLEALEKALKGDDRATLVSIVGANNETGVIQPLKEIVEICHAHGALIHSDAVQLAGKCDFDMQSLGLDLISLSAHKLGGPQGVGALVKRAGLTLTPLNKGGGQERSMRGGTENLSGIVGFGAAVEEKRDFSAIKALRDELEVQIKALGAVVFGETVERIPNTSYFAIEGMASERQVMALDLAGVMVSAGSACSSGKVKASHVLKAMGVKDELAGSAIRVSLGWNSTKEDIDFFVQAYTKIVERVQARKTSHSNAA
ncbi:cysteine desulfurase family protein [Terasakiella sp. SH-1]|uniref:cysteine desulfurase family protein n=1 Tax=Terasakiella sp. SH-1 TaxID=2560057 RepID=UPI0010742046|nr:cysteine desulfurase family protein [Terasakiella sp. SH-1]